MRLTYACETQTIIYSAFVNGDVDLNGDVSFADFLVLSSNFGQAATVSANWQSGDHDCDGNVDFTDFLLMSANFGQSAEAASVPEPSSKMIALSLLLLLPTLQRRRRSVFAAHGSKRHIWSV